jgi:probable addiction module antidote protein
MVRYRTFDEVLVEQLQEDPEFAQLYLKGSLEKYEKNKDAFYLLHSLKCIAKARVGMTELSRKSGLSRQSLYRIFKAEVPLRFDTLDAILNALGFRLSVLPLKPVQSKRVAS